MKLTIQKRVLAGLLSLAVAACQMPGIFFETLRASAAQQSQMSLSAFRSAVNALCAEDVPATAEDADRFATARLIVRAAGAIDTSGAMDVIEGYADLHILQYDSPAAAEAAYARFQTTAGVTSVEPSVYYQTVAVQEDSAVQTPLHTNWGAAYIDSDTYCAYLEAQGACPAVTVAVIDTGIDTDHPAFEGRIASGGADFTQSGSVEDGDGHGTQVAGIICDLTPETVKVLPLKVMQTATGAATETVYAALLYAAAQNAQVVSLGFTGNGTSPLLTEAIRSGREQGIVYCAAAGDQQRNAADCFPANVAECVTVSALKNDKGILCDTSNYGAGIDLAAPGESILTADPFAMRTSANGTAMAAAHVCACAALLKSRDPSFTAQEVEDILYGHALRHSEANDVARYGNGMLSMGFADDCVTACQPPQLLIDDSYFSQLTESPYIDAQSRITLISEDDIYYTTDGTAPSAENGTKYTTPLSFSASVELRAVAVCEGKSPSRCRTAWLTQNSDPVLADAFTVEDGVLTAYHGHAGALNLPAQINGQTVTAIGNDVFRGHTELWSVTLPDTVTTIGDRVFAGCTELTTFQGDSLEEIGAEAFAGTAMLYSIELPNLTRAGSRAFAQSTVSYLSLDRLTEIPAAFCKESGVADFSAPSATVVGASAFEACSSLNSCVLNWEGITAIEKNAFSGAQTAFFNMVSLPSLRTLGDAAFAGTYIYNMTLPDTLTVIPAHCFDGCTLDGLSAPGVTVIADYGLHVAQSDSEQVWDLRPAQFTSLGTCALSHLRLGDDICFSALTALSPFCVSDVSCESASFPLIKDVPANGLSGLVANAVCLPQVQRLAANAVNQSTNLFLKSVCTQLDENAVCNSLVNIYAPAESAAAAYAQRHGLSLYTAPLVVSLDQVPDVASLISVPVLSARAYAHSEIVAYQWYTTDADGSNPCALAGQTGRTLSVDTGRAAVQHFVCMATDRDGNTAQSNVQTIRVPFASLQTLTEGETVTIGQAGSGDDIVFRFCPARTDFYTPLLSNPNGENDGSVIVDITENRYFDFGTQELLAGHVYHLQVFRPTDPDTSIRLQLVAQSLAETRSCLDDESLNISLPDSVKYTGAPIRPEMTVLYNGVRLTEGVDYETVLHNNVFCGMASVSFYGIGAYYGGAIRYFSITDEIRLNETVRTALNYTGNSSYQFVPEVSGRYIVNIVTDNDCTAASQTCYAEWTDASGELIDTASEIASGNGYCCVAAVLNAGVSYTLSVKCSNYGNPALPCSILLSNQPVTLLSGERTEIVYDSTAFSYTGQPQSPALTVTFDGKRLVENEDYFLRVRNNVMPGLIRCDIIGIGAYCGNLPSSQAQIACTRTVGQVTTLDFEQETEITVSPDQVQFYRFQSGEAESFRLYIGNEAVGAELYLEEADGTLTPQNQRIFNNFHGLFADRTYVLAVITDATRTVETTLTLTPMTDCAAVAVSVPLCMYTGAEVTPFFRLTCGNKTLRQGTDYRVSYPDGCTTVGTHTASLYFTGNYFGSRSVEFDIVYPAQNAAPLPCDIGTTEIAISAPAVSDVRQFTPRRSQEYALCIAAAVPTSLWITDENGAPVPHRTENTAVSRAVITCFLEAGHTYTLRTAFCEMARTGSFSLTVLDRFRTLNCLTADCPATVEQNIFGQTAPPPFVLTDGDYVLCEGVDYAVTEQSNAGGIGTTTLQLVGLGRYVGTRTLRYDVVPPMNGLYPNAYELTAQSATFNLSLHDAVLLQFTARDAGTYAISLVNRSAACVQQFDEALNFVRTNLFIEDPNLTYKTELTLAQNETVYLLVTRNEPSYDDFNTLFFGTMQVETESVTTYVSETDGLIYNIDHNTNEAMLVGTEQPDALRLTVPAAVNGAPVTMIGRFALAQCEQLQELLLPDTLKRIEAFALPSTRLKSVRIPYGCQLDPQSVGYDSYAQSIADFALYGYLGDAAQTYAVENGLRFIALNPGEAKLARGDADANGQIDVSDAIVILRDYAGTMLGRPSALDADRRLAADVNNDGKRDAADAIAVLRVYASALLTGAVVWP